jgi:hypothetical protein
MSIAAEHLPLPRYDGKLKITTAPRRQIKNCYRAAAVNVTLKISGFLSL